ncbi:MAG: DUF58 domain-containing protein, partial [Candidatus Obscuribacterales bacterium]|nr:DUF58 domain-containing protein [Candidatus Obscuribacterales bacterium]
MPTSLNESWRQSPSLNKTPAQKSGPQDSPDQKELGVKKPGGLKIPLGSWTLIIEPRYFIIAMLILPLYVFACFVGNDWGYMLPCTLFASLIVGVVLPLIEVGSISFSYHVPPKSAALADQEIILKAWRLPFFGILSRLIPSGYLNARLHLTRRGWTGSKKVPAELPLPVVLQSLSQGVEMRIRTPALGRGVYEVDSVEISSCFPFAFVWWSRKIELDAESQGGSITVLPVLKDISGNFHSRLSTTTANSGRSQQSWMMQHRSTNFKGLREFTERDSLNQIHWSSSARSGKFL